MSVPAARAVGARLGLLFLWALLAVPGPTAAHAAPEPPSVDNARAQQDKPYVLLIGLDGFRHDYVARYGAKNLASLAARGTVAKALIPPFPSLTFPSMYTLVTGLRPEHHGIVDNQFFDPQRDASWQCCGGPPSTDDWYDGGTPLWVSAEQQGMRSATFFWISSDREVRHTRPTFFRTYDPKISRPTRVAQVLKWLTLPKAQRPHLVTVYFGDADTAGHEHGPDSAETALAVTAIDDTIGELVAGLAHVDPPIDVIVVSDHGMLRTEGSVDLRRFSAFEGVRFVASQVMVHVYGKDRAALDKVYTELKGKDPRFEVYRRAEIPQHLHYRADARIGELLVLPTGPMLLEVSTPGAKPVTRPPGMHGWDPIQFPELQGIFVAAGPHIRAGVQIDRFESIHVAPFITTLLGLKSPERLDGAAAVLAPILLPASQIPRKGRSSTHIGASAHSE